jgi:Rieske Fe-S protein
MSRDMNRREFVAVCCVAGAAALAGCASLVTHPVPVTAGRVRVSLADYPELSREDGAVKLLPAGREDPVYVLRARTGSGDDGAGLGYVALSPICTHRGCTVDVQGARLVCPCHGSTYDREGRVLRGPAQRALTRFPVTREGGALSIELRS